MEFFSKLNKPGRSDENKHPEASESMRLLEAYAGGQSEYARNAQINYLFRDGKQFTAEEINILGQRAHAAISWNMVHPLVENLKAIMAANRPRFMATGMEDSDGRTADLVSNVLEYVWYRNKGNQQLAYHLDDYSVGGMGVWLAWSNQAADGGRGEVYFRSIDPLKVYIDPNSSDRYARDAQHILLVEEFSAGQVINFYGDMISAETLAGLPQSTGGRYPTANQTYVSPEDAESLAGSTAFSSGRAQADLTEEPVYELVERFSLVKVERYELSDRANNRRQVFTSRQELQRELANRAVVVVDGRPFLEEQLVATYQQLAEQSEPDEQGIYSAHYAMDPQLGQPVLAPGDAAQGNPETAIPDSTVFYRFGNAADFSEQLEFEGALEISTQQLKRVKRVISIDHFQLHSEVLEISQIPIVPVMNRHNRNPYPKGDVDFLRGLQRHYNKLQSLVLAHTANVTSPKLLVPRGTDIEKVNEQMSRAGFGTVEMDLEFGTPVPLQVPSLSGQVFEQLRGTEMKMKQIVGVYDLMTGDAQAAPSTYYATMAIEEFGQRRMQAKRDVIEQGLTILGKIIFELAQATYGPEKVIRIFEPNNPERATNIQLNQPVYDVFGQRLTDRMNDISTIECDVRIISGSTLPANRWARFEQAKELYNLGLVDQVAVLKEADFPDKDHIIERMGIMQQLQQQLQQAQEEIKKLQGDMQTRERELFHARQRTELEKFKSTLKDDEVKTQRKNDQIIQDTQAQAQGFLNELQGPGETNNQTPQR